MHSDESLTQKDEFHSEFKVRMPTEVRCALILFWLNLAVSIAGWLYSIYLNYSTEGVGAFESKFVVIGYAMSIPRFILSAFLLVCISHKKNWARIAMLVFRAVDFGILLKFSLMYPERAIAKEGIQSAIDFAALYLIFFTKGRYWFARVS